MDAADHRERLVQVGAELEARARALRTRAGEVLRQIATPHTANLSARLADVLAAEEEADRVDRRGKIVRRALDLIGVEEVEA
jgi:hypothetical protein